MATVNESPIGAVRARIHSFDPPLLILLRPLSERFCVETMAMVAPVWYPAAAAMITAEPDDKPTTSKYPVVSPAAICIVAGIDTMDEGVTPRLTVTDSSRTPVRTTRHWLVFPTYSVPALITCSLFAEMDAVNVAPWYPDAFALTVAEPSLKPQAANTADVWPEGITTEKGTYRIPGLLLVRLTVRAESMAPPLRVTVHKLVDGAYALVSPARER